MKTLRHRDLSKIHIAQKQLGMDKETYRDMLWTLARVRSAADLDTHGRHKVLNHLKACGFKPKSNYPGRPHNVDIDPQLQKIEALLTDMKLPWSYARGIAKQMGIEQRKLEFLGGEQKGDIIVALTIKQRQQKKDAESGQHG